MAMEKGRDLTQSYDKEKRRDLTQPYAKAPIPTEK